MGGSHRLQAMDIRGITVSGFSPGQTKPSAKARLDPGVFSHA
jgi:hypothetical protein